MRNLIALLMIITTTHAWAHGEDKPGPHGGFISMPAGFHVELVPVDSQRVKVYLLDMEWKNPTLKDSSVAVKYGKTTAKCAPAGDHFVCEFPRSVRLGETGEIQLMATREKQKGASVSYSLPLKFKKH